jgi:carotenoid cleavage dioxygenase-like enzyme
MSLPFSRRRALALSGLGALSLLPVPLIGGCTLTGKTDGPSEDEEYPPWPFDPDESWWMQFNYAPVGDERTEMTLSVEGEIPKELDGLYLRTGSNPKNGDPGHWFLGNGMVHGVRLRGGKALWYRNRYVKTPLLDRAPGEGSGIPSNTDTASNVALVHHAGRLLSLGEVGFPYELSPDDLTTVGPYDFDGKLKTYMTAHPKLDPVTGELLFFGYNFSEPYLTYHAVDASGALVKSEAIKLPASAMMHDFQVTATKIVFLDLPILFDFEAAVSGSSFPFKWNDAHEPRIGIMPRTGGSDDVKWVSLDPCFIFHTLNAYDAPEGVVLEAARHPAGLWKDGPSQLGSRPTLHRFRIDANAGSVKLDELDDRLVEFPQLDRRRMTLEHRYGYGLWLKDPGEDGNLAGMQGVIKWDRQKDTSSVHEFSSALQPDEAFFVPRSEDSDEGDGFLMTYVYDRSTDRTDLYILDATDMGAKPLAKVKLPFRVPFGFHGLWVPA